MTKCKYFMNNICYSPYAIKTFGEPSSEPVNNNFCLTDKHSECKYYVETSFEKESTELYEAIGLKTTVDFYTVIHIIPCDQTSNCPFYKLSVINEEKQYCISQCIVSDRYLTKTGIRKCISNWKDCPFYKIGLEITS
ncbi:MAG: hypothetical protein QXP71_03970 [Desulfurococcaceae archaeon]